MMTLMPKTMKIGKTVNIGLRFTVVCGESTRKQVS